MIPVTIANGASASGAVDFRPFVVGGLITPAAWTAADIAFLVSTEEAGTYAQLRTHDTDALVKVTGITTDAADPRRLPLELAGWPWFKIQSVNTSTGAAENQGAARIITLVLKG